MQTDAPQPNFAIESPAPMDEMIGCIQEIRLNGEATVQDKFESYMSTIITTPCQNEAAYRLIEYVNAATESVTGISFESSVEREIVFVSQASQGINFISIDLDGDIMVSVTPFVGEGLRLFQDYNEINEVVAVDHFLS